MKNITRRNALILGLLSATISACSLRPFSGSHWAVLPGVSESAIA